MSAWVGNRLGSAVSWQQWRGGEWGWHGGPLTVSSDHSPLWRTFPEYLMNNISFYSQSLSSGEQTNNLTRSTVCNLTWSHFIFFSFKISTSSAPTTRCLTNSTSSAQTGSRLTATRSWRWVSKHRPREYYFSSERKSCILCLIIFMIFSLFWTRSDEFFFPIGFNVVFFNWFYLCT